MKLAPGDIAATTPQASEPPLPRTRRRGPKLTKEEVAQIRLALAEPKPRISQIARRFRIVRQSVHNIKKGLTHTGRPVGRPRKERASIGGSL